MRRAPLVPVALVLIALVAITGGLWKANLRAGATPPLAAEKCDYIRNLRMCLLHRMRRGPLQDGGVAEALVLGWKTDVNRDTKTNYRNAGLAHLLAVSGLHVGLLAGMVGILFWWTGRERKGRIVRGSLQLVAV